MSILEERVEAHMTATVVTASVDDDIGTAESLLRLHEISSLPVVGRNGDLAGVLSFRDLLQAGHVLGRMMGARTVLTLPVACVGDVMTDTPITVTVDQTLGEAAKLMLERRIHRVYVLRDGQIAGVLSTNDLLRLVADMGLTAPIARFASTPVLTVESSATLFSAVDKLATAHVSALVVVENGMPCGLFSQLEAVAQRDLSANTPVGEVLELSVICLPWRTPLSRAAAFASHSRARRVLTMDGTELRGILTALDFVRAAFG
jgi:CBS domain-containing protein